MVLLPCAVLVALLAWQNACRRACALKPSLTACVQATTDSAVEEAAKFIEPTRLYAPGRLLFITRETGKSKTPSHSIIDGDPDPKHRFKRIVLTSSLISDHLCTTYRSVLCALLWNLAAVQSLQAAWSISYVPLACRDALEDILARM